MPRFALLALAALASWLALALPAKAQQSPVRLKKEQATRVLTQVAELDVHLERSVEAFNLARIELSATARRLHANGRELAVARENLARAREIVAARIVYLYRRDGLPPLVEILVGARSFSDMLDQLDLERRAAEEDAQVLDEVVRFRAEVARERRQLQATRRRQARLVAELAERRASIEAQLAERQRMLTSIRTEVERLQAAERIRQERLRREARTRLAAAKPSVAPRGFGAAAELPEGVAVAPSSRHGHVVAIALRYLGVPYLWGGASPATGFDCSGFVMYVYAQVGMSLPHNAALQYGYGVPVAKGDLQPGDIVFFNNLGHNGIYIGGGQFIQAPRTGDVVKISSLSEPWYASTYYGAKRLT